MPVANVTYLCPMSAASAVPGHVVFGVNTARIGYIKAVRPATHPWNRLGVECLVHWSGDSETWKDAHELHDYDTYLAILEAELVGHYQARFEIDQRFGLPVRPALNWRP